MITLERLNAASRDQLVQQLGAIYEHSAWVAERVAAQVPFAHVLALHEAMAAAVMQADEPQQLALIRAHPELAGKAAIRGELTPDSTREQRGAGLSACSPTQYARLQQLNTEYGQRFGFPFVLAVRGHTPDSVIAALERRVTHGAAEEREVALHEISRIARFRLADLIEEPAGAQILWMSDELARASDHEGVLTCAYLTPAHRATAHRIRDYMLAAGLEAHIDDVGNVVGMLHGQGSEARRLLTGSHYDTVSNAGRYDGRLGILLPIVVAAQLRRAGVVLPWTLEIIAFAEEEGLRFRSTFLGSRAVCGRFDPALLESTDTQGTSMRAAIEAAGHDPARIAAIARNPAQLLGFVEVHIEQGPVLLEGGQPLGVVTAIAGSIRTAISVQGQAGHAGTVPMTMRQDAAAGAAEMVLAVERRAAAQPGLVGTVGRLEVPDGATNVIPGRCELTLDLRSGSDAQRDAAFADIADEITAIAARRRLQVSQRRLLEARAVTCAPVLQEQLAASIARVTGAPAPRLPSGAGHDAMMMANIVDVGMLFVRCGNHGISHHPDEALTAADAGIAAQAFHDFLLHFEVT